MKFATIVSHLLALAASTAPVFADYPGDDLSFTSCGFASGGCADLYFFGTAGGGPYYYCLTDDDCGGPVPGPLIRVDAGYIYRLTLHNRVAGEVTNLHPHGLHVPGDRDVYDIGSGRAVYENSDDVTHYAQPGQSITYDWNIDPEHPAGTFWYHAHVHGITQQQVTGGAYGMLIVNDSGRPQDPVGTVWQEQDVLNKRLLLLATKVGNSVKANGVEAAEDFTVTSGEWYRLRFGLADPTAKVQPVSFDGCIVREVANDGVYLSTGETTLPSPTYQVTGASRVDFLVCCEGSTTMTMTVKNTAVATFSADGAATCSPGSWTPTRPDALDIPSDPMFPVDPANQVTISMSGSLINGESWDVNRPLEDRPPLTYNEIHEWTLGGTASHPFHIHIWHMLVVTPGGCGLHKNGEFYDTIASNGECKVRFKTVDYGGRTIFHCHVLDHEDKGAISWVNVSDSTAPAPPPTFSPAPTSSPLACGEQNDPCDASGDGSDCCSGVCKPNGRCARARRLGGN